MKLAPEIPTTQELHKKHPLDVATIQKVKLARKTIAQALNSGESPVIIAGPCAMASGIEKHLEENKFLATLGDELGFIDVFRDNPWKPRSNPDESWWGHETEEPEEAFLTARAVAQQSGNLALEIGDEMHMERYGGSTTFAWRGSRNAADNAVLEAMASNSSLPVGIKNGMDGSIDSAILDVEAISEMRSETTNPAPAMLIFRGGSDLTNPAEWMRSYENAHETTGGKIILDLAHGSEMAFDPDGNFSKTHLGQRACLAAVLESGMLPRAFMIEVSDIPSPTDPVVPLNELIEDARSITVAHRQYIGISKLSAAAD